jgi:hypothetical protein
MICRTYLVHTFQTCNKLDFFPAVALKCRRTSMVSQVSRHNYQYWDKKYCSWIEAVPSPVRRCWRRYVQFSQYFPVLAVLCTVRNAQCYAYHIWFVRSASSVPYRIKYSMQNNSLRRQYWTPHTWSPGTIRTVGIQMYVHQYNRILQHLFMLCTYG